MWAAVGGLAVVGVFAAVVYYLAKKDGQKDEERISNLTEEQKKILLETPYLEAPGFPNGVLAHGLIYEIPKMTGSKVELVVMLNQAATDRLELADLMGISEQQLFHITNVKAGHGLVKIGASLVPFSNRLPNDTELYRLMTTKPGE